MSHRIRRISNNHPDWCFLLLLQALGVLGEELREDIIIPMLIQLEGISQTDAIIHLVFLRMHNIMIDSLDIYIGYVVRQQNDLVAMDFVLVLAQHVFLLNQSTLQQTGNERSGSYKRIKDVHILFSQRGVELLLQNVLNAMDDKVNALNRRIDNTQLFNRQREGSLKELLVEVLNDGLLSLQVIDVADVVLD